MDYHLHEFFILDQAAAGQETNYHYNFGDSWRHKIEVKRLIDDFEKNHPVCIDGEGAAPPEDVGGEGGFSQFLDIRANPDDSEYEYMEQWAASQGYESFNLEKMNQRLKDL